MADLTELQAEFVAERAARGFTTDPVRVLALLVEETGEAARELKKTRRVDARSRVPARRRSNPPSTGVVVVELIRRHPLPAVPLRDP